MTENEAKEKLIEWNRATARHRVWEKWRDLIKDAPAAMVGLELAFVVTTNWTLFWWALAGHFLANLLVHHAKRGERRSRDRMLSAFGEANPIEAFTEHPQLQEWFNAGGAK